MLPTLLEQSGVRGTGTIQRSSSFFPKLPLGLHRHHYRWSQGQNPEPPPPAPPEGTLCPSTFAGHQSCCGWCFVTRALWPARQPHINPTPPSILDIPCESQTPSHSSPPPSTNSSRSPALYPGSWFHTKCLFGCQWPSWGQREVASEARSGGSAGHHRWPLLARPFPPSLGGLSPGLGFAQQGGQGAPQPHPPAVGPGHTPCPGQGGCTGLGAAQRLG